jgi:hypothetical protein
MRYQRSQSMVALATTQTHSSAVRALLFGGKVLLAGMHRCEP